MNARDNMNKVTKNDAFSPGGWRLYRLNGGEQAISFVALTGIPCLGTGIGRPVPPRTFLSSLTFIVRSAREVAGPR